MIVNVQKIRNSIKMEYVNKIVLEIACIQVLIQICKKLLFVHNVNIVLQNKLTELECVLVNIINLLK